MSKHPSIENLLLLLVLLAAILLRFWNLGTDSITHDELSALFRLQYNSVGEVIQAVGVQHDAHPVGVQVFLYYWTNWFGDSPFVLRFPFALAGVLAVYTSFLLGRLLFSPVSGLLVATCLAVLEYPVVYSQLARPYSFGLFFTLASAYFLFRFCKVNNRRSLSLGMFIVFTILSCYTHYFALMQVGLLGICGLLIVPKNLLKHYVLSLAAIALLFVPHLSIFFQQIAYKGLDWLKEPGALFLPEYIWYAFNYSWWMLALVAGVAILLSILKTQSIAEAGLRWISLLLFVVPFLVGFCYSIWVKPVLQPSLLLFAFPFLLLFVFSLAGKQKKLVLASLATILLLAGLGSTLLANKFYQKHHFAPYLPIAERTYQWNERYGAENISRVLNVGKPFFIDYYFKRNGGDKPEVLAHSINKKEQLAELQKLVEQANTPYFMYAWTNGYHPQEILEVIKEKFPYLIKREWYFNAEIYLFAKEGHSNIQEEALFSTNCKVMNCEEWGMPIADSLFCFSPDKEFSPTFHLPLNELNISEFDVFTLKAEADIPQKFKDATLVLSFEREGESLAWKSSSFSDFISTPGKRTFYVSHHLPPEVFKELQSATLKAYLWNNEQQSFCLEELELKVEKGNPVLYNKYYIPK